jgi:hypothetical protein
VDFIAMRTTFDEKGHSISFHFGHQWTNQQFCREMRKLGRGRGTLKNHGKFGYFWSRVPPGGLDRNPPRTTPTGLVGAAVDWFRPPHPGGFAAADCSSTKIFFNCIFEAINKISLNFESNSF